MTRVLGILRSTSLMAAALMFLSCASAKNSEWVELKPADTGSGQSLHIQGTVHHLDLEGGVYVIRDAAGTSYNPTNLPAEYRVDGLAVEADARRRDDVVSIGMVGTMVDLERIRKAASSEAEPPNLVGTTWLLEDLAGAGVIDRIQATLSFSANGTASGNASCNQFNGPATVSGSTVSFGPLATTRKMCPEAVMDQERRYLEALRGTVQFERKESFLYIYAAGQSQPLRFIAMDESESAPR